MSNFKIVETILYVRDQELSTRFYTKILRREPDLNVPGMTQFNFNNSFILGLMPNNGIAKIISGEAPHPDTGFGIPRCELYLHVSNVLLEFENAKEAGAKIICPIEEREWGDTVCYFADPDGHILAFAEMIEAS